MSMVIHPETTMGCICDRLLSRPKVFSVFSNEKVITFVRVVIEIIDNTLSTVVGITTFSTISFSRR